MCWRREEKQHNHGRQIELHVESCEVISLHFQLPPSPQVDTVMSYRAKANDGFRKNLDGRWVETHFGSCFVSILRVHISACPFTWFLDCYWKNGAKPSQIDKDAFS